jgi:hypothetical protein
MKSLAFAWYTWAFQVAGLSGFLIGLTILGCYLRFGSRQAVVTALDPPSLSTSPNEIDLGVVNVGAIIPLEVTVTNHLNDDVSVLGIDKCCGTELAMDAPVRVPARGNQTLRLTHIANGRGGERFVRPVRIVTTSDCASPTFQIIGSLSAVLIPEPDGNTNRQAKE